MGNSLTPSQLRYLVTIDRLMRERKPLRVTTIARDLGLARSSVHNMLDCFIEQGLMVRNDKGVCRLTGPGEETVARVGENYRSICGILRAQFPQVPDPSEAAYLLISGQDR